MNEKMKAIAGVLAITVLVGCQSNPSKESVGVVTGGILGGVIGNQVGDKGTKTRTTAIIAGTIAGGMIGGAIGGTMDEVDRMKLARTLEYNSTNQPMSWQNPDSGNRYTATPIRTYQAREGTPCREYSVDAVIGGAQEKLYGTACRQADGAWHVQSSNP